MFRNVYYKIIVKWANNNVLGLLFSLYKIQFKDCLVFKWCLIFLRNWVREKCRKHQQKLICAMFSNVLLDFNALIFFSGRSTNCNSFVKDHINVLFEAGNDYR